MPAFIHSLATAVPPFVHQQSDLEELFLSKIEDRRIRMLLKRSFRGAGIETRHSVCERFFSGDLYDDSARATTGERNRRYAIEARTLARACSENLLNEANQMAGEISHLVYASCTGLQNPGPDYHLIHDLGLNHGVQRYVLGSMGCYSAVPALKLAKTICESEPDALVLVVVLELCSLHLKIGDTYDSVLATSLFGDGAGAALISAKDGIAQLGEFATGIIPEGEPDMSWEIGDQGFDLVLSKRVPQILESEAGDFINRFQGAQSIDHWAVHPGGRGIIDAIEKAVPVPADKLTASREILRRFGNMAGATVLFVIKEIMESPESAPGETILATSFGPGMTVEAGFIHLK